MITKYTLTAKGEVDRIASFLTDLVERGSTSLNKKYKLRISNISWDTDMDNNSVVKAGISVDSKFISKSDLDDIRDSYAIRLTNKKVSNDKAIA
jgi:hypothetical protein